MLRDPSWMALTLSGSYGYRYGYTPLSRLHHIVVLHANWEELFSA